jgi:hypothetical protein
VIRLSGVIVYRDGRREPFEASGIHQTDWEAYAHRNGLQITPTEATLPSFPLKTWQIFMAYASLGLEEGFDAWKRSVLDVEAEQEAEELQTKIVPPTLREATAELSSSSRSGSAGA